MVEVADVPDWDSENTRTLNTAPSASATGTLKITCKATRGEADKLVFRGGEHACAGVATVPAPGRSKA